MKTLVISAFPATGKTYTTEKLKAAGWSVLDLDSSEFHWTCDDEGNIIKNPDFVKDYLNAITRQIGRVDIIFVSTHDEVRKAMDEIGIEYIIVYPDISLKETWIGRCFLRGDSDDYCRKIAAHWETWIKDIEKDHNYVEPTVYKLSSYKFITLEDVINDIFRSTLAKLYNNYDFISIGSFFKTRELEKKWI